MHRQRNNVMSLGYFSHKFIQNMFASYHQNSGLVGMSSALIDSMLKLPSDREL